MLLDQVTPGQMQAGGLVMGAAMVGLVGSRWLPRYGQAVRVAVTVAYVAVVLGFLVYFLV